MPYQTITALMEILHPEIDLSKRRLETLCLIVIGMVSARSVNLSHLACERPGAVKVASTYRRLQRFFQHVRFEEDWALPLLVRLLGLNGSWLLALDRTQWRIGKAEVNYLVLAVVTPRFRARAGCRILQGECSACASTGDSIWCWTEFQAPTGWCCRQTSGPYFWLSRGRTRYGACHWARMGARQSQ